MPNSAIQKLSFPATQVPLDTIMQGDCITCLASLPDQSVDLVFADPPYNLQLRGALHRPDESAVSGVHDAWDKFDTFKHYDEFTTSWMRECRRVLKPHGALWVIGSYHNIYRVGAIAQDLGFWLLNDVIWVKTNPMPNFRGRRFTNAHETLIWASQSEKSRYTFNYQALKAGNDDLQMRSDWLMPLCGGGERLRDPEGNKVHPTQKPQALLHRIILATSNVGDIVLDPFFGTGTTGAVAKTLGRHWIGIERDPDYAAAAQQRIDQTEPLSTEAVSVVQSATSQPRVPFGQLIDRGMITPGATLVGGKSQQHRATVRADGSVLCGEISGSIHKTSANLEGRESCNGWSYWHVEVEGQLHPIESLRQRIRDEFSN